MPPNRTDNYQQLANREGRLIIAVTNLKNGKVDQFVKAYALTMLLVQLCMIGSTPPNMKLNNAPIVMKLRASKL